MKICFNGWYSGFIDKINPVHVDFFIELFKNVYNEDCEIGDITNSEILCEFDMLLDCPGSYVNYKKWKQTYLFNGESTMKCNPNNYDVVLNDIEKKRVNGATFKELIKNQKKKLKKQLFINSESKVKKNIKNFVSNIIRKTSN